MERVAVHAIDGRHVPLSIRTRKIPLTEELRHIIRGCVSTAVGRVAERVRNVFVWLEDTNGPKGGKGVACRIEIRPVKGGRLTATAEATTEFTAIGRAANRARVRLLRAIRKRRRGRREAPPAPAAL